MSAAPTDAVSASSAPPPTARPDGRQPRAPGRSASAAVWGLAALTILIVSSVLATRQSPHPDAYRIDEGWRKFFPPPVARWDSWAYPIERNAFMRLPYLNRDLLGLYSPDGSERVWVLGEDGMLMHSPDFAATWQDWSIPADVWDDIRREAVPAIMKRQDSKQQPPAAIPRSAPERLEEAKPAEKDRAKKGASLPPARSVPEVHSFGLIERQLTFGYEDPPIKNTPAVQDSQRNKPAAPKLPLNTNSAAPPAFNQAPPQQNPTQQMPDLSPLPVTPMDPDDSGLINYQERIAASLRIGLTDGGNGWLGLNTVTWSRSPSGKWARSADTAAGAVASRSDSVVRGQRSITISKDRELLRDGSLSQRLEPDNIVKVAGWTSAKVLDLSSVPGTSPELLVTIGTEDGGLTWQARQIDPSQARLYADGPTSTTAPAPGSLVADPAFWALRTVAPGRTQPVVLPYARFPAPWYYTVLLLGVFPLTFMAVRAVIRDSKLPPVAIENQKSGIEGLGTSDAPLQPGDRDVLDLDGRAEAMARFLRNPETTSPLTIAVEGPWGTGKSSYMNLLQGKLDAAGFSTVAFNAWHHQTESSLLAALLQHIRTDGKPGWTDVRGLLGPRFRWKLLAARFEADLKRSPIKIATYALLGSFSITMFFWHPAAVGGLVTDAARMVTPIWTALTTDGEAKPTTKGDPAKALPAPAELADNTGKPPAPATAQPADATARSGVDVLFGKGLLGIVAFLTTLLPTIKGLRAFGVNPLDMIKHSSTGGADGKDSGKVTISSDFRTQFAREFREVTEAIGPDRKMVIFIDDLDRCDAASVVQVLQAMNYLVTAGPCVLVAAIDPEYVRACIRLKFKDLIGELAAGRPAAGPAAPADADASTPPEDFAAHFLQKLVQVHEPIPRLDAAQTLAMFERAVQVDVKPTPTPRRQTRAVRLLRHRAVAPAAMVLLAMVGAVAGMRFSPISDAEIAAQSQAATSGATASGTGKSPDQAGTDADKSRPGGTGVRAMAGQTAPQWQLWYALPALAAMGLLVLTIVPTLGTALPSPVRDSPEFTRALQRYAPLLYAAGRTPREIKRLLNAMRLMATRQELLLDEAQQVRQSELVGLSVLHDLDPRWVTASGVDETALRAWCRKLPKDRPLAVPTTDPAKPGSQVEAKADEDTLVVCAVLYARLLGSASGVRGTKP